MRGIGSKQKLVLVTMHKHHGGEWSSKAGWIWGTESNTKAIMTSLAKRGYVQAFVLGATKFGPGISVGGTLTFRITNKGIEEVERIERMRELA